MALHEHDRGNTGKLSRLAQPTPVKAAIDDPVWIAGRNEGRSRVKRAILTHLEEHYMDPSIKRGTPEAKALLKLASELAAKVREEDFGA